MVFAPYVTWLFLKDSTLDKGDIYDQLGMRLSGLFFAFVTPLALTMILFMGPLTMQFLSGTWKIRKFKLFRKLYYFYQFLCSLIHVLMAWLYNIAGEHCTCTWHCIC